tara:strand:+ start:48 stop:443 length:396 start_codon:yes stop_codon:yes gene_type:complete
MKKTIAQQLNIKEFPFKIKDKNGNGIYLENTNNNWTRWEYGECGNILFSENSDGVSCEYSYESDGTECRRVYRYREPYAHWVKYEYNKEGDVIYREDCKNGVVFDKRPKPTHEGNVVEIDGKKYKLTELKD